MRLLLISLLALFTLEIQALPNVLAGLGVKEVYTQNSLGFVKKLSKEASTEYDRFDAAVFLYRQTQERTYYNQIIQYFLDEGKQGQALLFAAEESPDSWEEDLPESLLELDFLEEFIEYHRYLDAFHTKDAQILASQNPWIKKHSSLLRANIQSSKEGRLPPSDDLKADPFGMSCYIKGLEKVLRVQTSGFLDLCVGTYFSPHLELLRSLSDPEYLSDIAYQDNFDKELKLLVSFFDPDSISQNTDETHSYQIHHFFYKDMNSFPFKLWRQMSQVKRWERYLLEVYARIEDEEIRSRIVEDLPFGIRSNFQSSWKRLGPFRILSHRLLSKEDEKQIRRVLIQSYKALPRQLRIGNRALMQFFTGTKEAWHDPFTKTLWVPFSMLSLDVVQQQKQFYHLLCLNGARSKFEFRSSASFWFFDALCVATNPYEQADRNHQIEEDFRFPLSISTIELVPRQSSSRRLKQLYNYQLLQFLTGESEYLLGLWEEADTPSDLPSLNGLLLQNPRIRIRRDRILGSGR